jgi:RNA polymerase sigma factor (sigma-70 family)
MAALPATLLRHITHRAAASAPDAVLLQRFVAHRDADALAGLVRRHGPVVYRVCRRLLGPSAADDAFQATFLVLATRAAAIRKAGSVGSWLVGVAGRVARQMRKAERRRAAHEAAVPAPAGGSTLDHSEAAERSRILDEELTCLSDRLRGPVVACLLQGRTYEQAAAELGGSARTVRRRLDEAKRVLRARLERRGVVPAIAAGLVAGVGTAEATVPTGLGPRTAAALADFLAGGATIPAAVIAKGVATTMTTTARTVSALLATAAAGLTALGVGLAGDGQPAPPQPAPPPVVAENPPAALNAPPAPAVSTTTARGSVLNAPSPGVMRAIEHEAKYLSEYVSRRWFGPDRHAGTALTLDACGAANGQPFPPPPDRAIRVMYWTNARWASNTRLTFDDGLSRAWIDLSGPLENVINDQLPREMTRVVMAERFGAPLPWWADEGIVLTALSAPDQGGVDIHCRTAIREGRAIRLTALFALRDPPPDANAAKAQAHSIIRFLLAGDVRLAGKISPPTADGPDPRCAAIVDFLRQGMRDGWNKAAKAVYGFENVAALETAWIEWMKGKESQLLAPPPVVEMPPPRAHPPLIPPVKLP